MASVASAKLLEGVSELVECGICSEELYTDPKDLPCRHTFCAECIKDWAGKCQKATTCPICRREFSIPVGGIASLPLNATIAKLVELSLVSSREVKGLMCNVCADEEEKAVNKMAS